MKMRDTERTRCFRHLLPGGCAAMMSRWLVAVLAAVLIVPGAIVLAQNTAPKASPESAAILQFLNQTIDWYRQQTALQRIADDPEDASVVNDNRQMTDQVVRLAFEFARAEAESASNRGSQTQAQNPDLSQYQGLAQIQARLDQQIKETQAETDTLRQKLEGASGKKRQQLQAQLAETQAEIDLAKARRDAIQNMSQFVSGTGSNGLERLTCGRKCRRWPIPCPWC